MEANFGALTMDDYDDHNQLKHQASPLTPSFYKSLSNKFSFSLGVSLDANDSRPGSTLTSPMNRMPKSTTIHAIPESELINLSTMTMDEVERDLEGMVDVVDDGGYRIQDVEALENNTLSVFNNFLSSAPQATESFDENLQAFRQLNLIRRCDTVDSAYAEYEQQLRSPPSANTSFDDNQDNLKLEQQKIPTQKPIQPKMQPSSSNVTDESFLTKSISQEDEDGLRRFKSNISKDDSEVYHAVGKNLTKQFRTNNNLTTTSKDNENSQHNTPRSRGEDEIWRNGENLSTNHLSNMLSKMQVRLLAI
jgi:hypothetical protein